MLYFGLVAQINQRIVVARPRRCREQSVTGLAVAIYNAVYSLY